MLTSEIFSKPLNDLVLDVCHQDFKIWVFVPIELLHPNQLEVDADVVERKMRNSRLNTVPYVVLKAGRFILIDGHHTVTGKKLKGIKKVKCLFHSI